MAGMNHQVSLIIGLNFAANFKLNKALINIFIPTKNSPFQWNFVLNSNRHFIFSFGFQTLERLVEFYSISAEKTKTIGVIVFVKIADDNFEDNQSDGPIRK